MAWVRLDDQFPDHPKVAGLSNDAFCLHVTAMCYTARQQTDGKLPCGLLKRLAWRCHDPAIAVAELVASGVWDEDGENGWAIHDYLDYNPSKSELETLAVTRSEAGKAGAMARWQNHSKPDGKSHGKPYGKHDGKIMPHSPSPSDDEKGLQGAIDALHVLGMFNKTMLDQLTDMWPELEGRKDWIGRAITVARDSGARAPLPYALKVLANSIHTGKEPGYIPPSQPKNGTDPTIRRGAPSEFTAEERAAADARQEAYERQFAEELARAGKL